MILLKHTYLYQGSFFKSSHMTFSFVIQHPQTTATVHTITLLFIITKHTNQSLLISEYLQKLNEAL